MEWHQRPGCGVHADVIMDRIIHNAVWVVTASYSMRKHTVVATA
ncbi:hypothetical protein [Arthrobacter sp. TB 23]|nr:hypothetical protein [Arthrobacter sp. TB 23]